MSSQGPASAAACKCERPVNMLLASCCACDMPTPRPAAACRRPVLIQGEAGLAKGNLGAVLHSCSPDRRFPMAALDCSSADPTSAARSLQSWLRQGGSLLLQNAERAPPALLEALLSGGKGCCGEVSRGRGQLQGGGRRVVLLGALGLPLACTAQNPSISSTSACTAGPLGRWTPNQPALKLRPGAGSLQRRPTRPTCNVVTHASSSPPRSLRPCRRRLPHAALSSR